MDAPLLFPRSTHGCFEDVKLRGRNTGSSLMVTQGSSRGLQDYCSINIYISNNVQGVNNSVLVGSEVRQGDPGVSVSLKGLKMDKGFQKTHEKMTSAEVVSWITLFSVVAMILFSILYV